MTFTLSSWQTNEVTVSAPDHHFSGDATLCRRPRGDGATADLRAVTLFGLADHAHSQIHYVIAGPIRALADAGLAKAQTALDPMVFAEAFVVGPQMSLVDAWRAIDFLLERPIDVFVGNPYA